LRRGTMFGVLRGVGCSQRVLKGGVVLGRGSLSASLRTATVVRGVAKDAVVVEEASAQANVLLMKAYIEQETREKISTTDFLGACKKHGISEEQGRDILTKLHEGGSVLHLTRSPELSSQVFLKPEVVTSAVMELLDPQDENRAVHAERLKQKLAALREKIRGMESVRDDLMATAERRADRLINLGLTYVIAQGAIVARLTWWELSWDIMEPITYMLTFTTGGIGLLYFTRVKQEYTYESLRDNMVKRRFDKLVEASEYDEEVFQSLKVVKVFLLLAGDWFVVVKAYLHVLSRNVPRPWNASWRAIVSRPM